MNYYFLLQYKMLNRHVSGFGINPFLGYVLFTALFIGASHYLFAKTTFATYIYPFIALGLATKLSETHRNAFLKSCFTNAGYFKIRVMENAIFIFPFFSFLLFNGSVLIALALLFSSSLMAFLNFDDKLNYTLPTPFNKSPFEFTVGFRKTFFVFFLAYIITYMAISAGNFNLGMFSLILVFLTILTYYTTPENEYYVWVFSLSAKKFLLRKIKTALLSSTLLCLPITLGMSIFFPEKIFLILGFQCLCFIYLATALLGKYAAFPEQINLSQGFLIAFSVWFPPLLIGVIPYFYAQSIKRLNEILE